MFFKDLKTIIKDHELNAAVSKTFEFSLIPETALRKDTLTIIPVALKGHAFSLVVRKVHDIHIIAICNKSVHKGYNGLVYFIVDINKLFTSVFFRDLDGLRDYEINEKNSVGVPKYFEKIKELFLQKYAPDKISDAEKTILRDLKSIHQPKNQKVGNCTLTAAKVACLAAIILKSYDQYGKDYWIETIKNIVLHRYKTEISIPLREEYFKIAKEILPTKYPVLMGWVESKYIHYMQKVVPKNPI